MKRIECFVSIMVTLGLVGCASSYNGPAPRLALNGKEAQEEFQKFEITKREKDFSIGLGNEVKRYDIRSFTPIIKSVSTEGYEKIEFANKLRKSQEISLLIGIAGLVLFLSDTNNNLYKNITYGGSIVSIGLSFTWGSRIDEGISFYNRDLKRHLIEKN